MSIGKLVLEGKKTFVIGRGEHRVRRMTLEFRFDAHMDKLTETIHHEKAPDTYLSFSMMGSYNGSAGQCVEEIINDIAVGWRVGSMDTFDGNGNPIFTPNPEKQITLVRVLDAWRRWHLNDMRPGCAHQTTGDYREAEISGQKCYEVPHREPYRHYIYKGCGNYPKLFAQRKLADEIRSGTPGPWTAMFDQQYFYSYGSAWLLDPLPEPFFMEFARMWADLDGGFHGIAANGVRAELQAA